ncbi:MAG: hypothetical protein MJ252_12530 [archaeon]|nr:hypothetical protein [archaeon]
MDDDDADISYSDESISEDNNRTHILPLPTFRRKKRTIIIDWLCRFLEIIGFGMSSAYNILWLIVFRYSEYNFGNISNHINLCEDLHKYKKNILLSCEFNIAKGIIFLSVSKFCCGTGKDFTLFCLIIKSILGVAISSYFVFYVPKALEIYKKKFRDKIYIEKEYQECEFLDSNIFKFYIWEKFYCKVVWILLGIIFIAIALVMVKEMWKGRGYKVR